MLTVISPAKKLDMTPVDMADATEPAFQKDAVTLARAARKLKHGDLQKLMGISEPLAKLNEYNIAGPTTFVQHAGVAALRDGDLYVDGLVDRLRRRRDLVTQALSQFPRVRYTQPDAAFYAFFAVDGMDDSLGFALRLRNEANVGVAPGIAFGPSGEGYLRLCFASSEGALSEAMERLQPWLS